MKTRYISLIIFTILFSLPTSRSVVQAQGHSTGETTGSSPFTYQGQVLQNGEPVNGTCDFQFSLWDAANARNQIGNLTKLRCLETLSTIYTPG